ncbi:MAG: hypothetical protein NVSMB56_14020 [Pyrinomonadaceae bacterium]
MRRNGEARAWSFEASLNSFTLRITARNLAGNFYLFCGACEHIEFDTYWTPIDIHIEQDNGMYIVSDNSHLFVKCGIIAGKYNVSPVF